MKTLLLSLTLAVAVAAQTTPPTTPPLAIWVVSADSAVWAGAKPPLDTQVLVYGLSDPSKQRSYKITVVGTFFDSNATASASKALWVTTVLGPAKWQLLAYTTYRAGDTITAASAVEVIEGPPIAVALAR